ncbi:hypothetical protein [Nocardia transvalensis]|uniref:hypothetical protein n=1 Tax=Nocardia transvalensis TaxID=37333 RepID=UPI001893A686|nr:hypothetical protein [Nocardia transvalensis]MBF6329853.1 hypothetical protein [Nocardia transvalensis]
MRMKVAMLTAAVVAAGTAVAPTGFAAGAQVGACGGGEFRWTAAEGAITMSPQWLTFTSTGVLHECVGTEPGITGGTFTGVHTARSDCMRPADGPITVTVTWSDGRTSVLSGPWPVAVAQPTIGVLEVSEGLGHGNRVRIVAEYDVLTADNVAGCMGPGVRTGTGRVLGATFE